MVTVMEETNKMIEAYTAKVNEEVKVIFDTKQIYEAIMNYNSNMNQYEMLLMDIQEVSGSGLTAKWGIEAIMPKGSGGITDVVFREYERRLKMLNGKRKTVDKLELIQKFCCSIWFDEMREDHQNILNEVLNGESLTDIALRNGVTTQAIHKKLNKIAIKIKDFQFVPGV